MHWFNFTVDFVWFLSQNRTWRYRLAEKLCSVKYFHCILLLFHCTCANTLTDYQSTLFTTSSGVVAGSSCPHPKFYAVGKFCSKNTKSGAGNPPFGGNLGTIEILSTHNHNVLCQTQKVAAVCPKIANSCTPLPTC